MLIFHFGYETGCLEEALAVPTISAKRSLPVGKACDAARIVGKHVLDVVNKTIMLGVEYLVNSLKRDILITTAIAADRVQVEQFIVVLASRHWIQTAAGCTIGVRGFGRSGRAWTSAMRDVVQEGGVDAERIQRGSNWSGRVALYETASRHVLRKTAQRTGDKFSVRIGRDHRNVVNISVNKLHAKHGRRLILDHCPGSQAAISRAEELAR